MSLLLLFQRQFAAPAPSPPVVVGVEPFGGPGVTAFGGPAGAMALSDSPATTSTPDRPSTTFLGNAPSTTRIQ